MKIKGSIFVLLLLILLGNVLFAKNIVVPTYYGYGVVSDKCAFVQPYISAYYPYALPVCYANGYYSKIITPALTSSTGTVSAIPVWNGAFWYYQPVGNATLAVVSCNLNVRSQPKLGSKSRNSNVIAMLKSNEPVYVFAKEGNWYLVQSVYAPIRRGYVYKSYLRFYRYGWPVNSVCYSSLPVVNNICWY